MTPLMDQLRSYELLLLLLLYSFLDDDPATGDIRAVIQEGNDLAYRTLRGSLAALSDPELKALDLASASPPDRAGLLEADAEILRTRRRAVRHEARRRSARADEVPTVAALEVIAREAARTWAGAARRWRTRSGGCAKVRPPRGSRAGRGSSHEAGGGAARSTVRAIEPADPTRSATEVRLQAINRGIPGEDWREPGRSGMVRFRCPRASRLTRRTATR
jgi:hypothetical protein